MIYNLQLEYFISKVAIMCPKFDINDSEKALFRKAVEKIKPLKHTKSASHTTPSPRVVIAPFDDSKQDAERQFSDYENLPHVTGDDYLEFARLGIQHKVLRKLRSGQYNIEAILDLHGEIVAEAKQSLSYFLLQCEQKGIRHVLIIHGKGRNIQQPVLKNRLNHWLRETEQVLAFCSAKSKDGHSGALYVLLKNIKGGI